MQTAFKEWAVVVDALRRGEQTVILRKGGIHERFALRSDRFWLYPTAFHQQREGVREEYRHFTLPKDPPEIQALAEVAAVAELTTREPIEALAPFHIWCREVVRKRFEWGRRHAVHAMLVRIHTLPRPRAIPPDDAYGGCLSWIELKPPMPEEGLRPVLDDRQFEPIATRFREVVP